MPLKIYLFYCFYTALTLINSTKPIKDSALNPYQIQYTLMVM